MKQAQAAMEFFMTYGWVIFLVLAALSSLVYFGILDFSSMLPEQTVFPAPFMNLEPAAIAANGTITLHLQNTVGEPLQILSTGYHGTDDCSSITQFSTEKTMVLPNEDVFISFTCQLPTGTKRIKSFLSFQYNNTKTGSVHTHTGYVVLNVP